MNFRALSAVVVSVLSYFSGRYALDHGDTDLVLELGLRSDNLPVIYFSDTCVFDVRECRRGWADINALRRRCLESCFDNLVRSSSILERG